MIRRVNDLRGFLRKRLVWLVNGRMELLARGVSLVSGKGLGKTIHIAYLHT